MKKLLFVFIFIFSVSGTSAGAFALQNTPTTSYDGSAVVQKITITGVVPYMRVIYVNSKNQLVKVVGNTDKNIQPMAIDIATKKQVKTTSFILSRYQKVLAANNNRLEAGKTYYPAPDKLSLKPALLKFSLLKLPAF